jgi:hypothetical protein
MGIDTDEARPLFLGSSRRDANTARIAILAELDAALRDLGKNAMGMSAPVFVNWLAADEFVLRNYQMAEMPPAPRQIVTSLRNWVEGNGTVAREETDFLNYEHDLFTTAKGNDGAMSVLQPWIEAIAVRFYDLFQMVHITNPLLSNWILITPAGTGKCLTRWPRLHLFGIGPEFGYSHGDCLDSRSTPAGSNHRYASYLKHSASCFMYFLFIDHSSSRHLVLE